MAVKGALVLAAMAMTATAEGAVDVRFCPEARVHTYPLASERGVQSLVLQNAAIVNRGPTALDIQSIAIQLARAGSIVDERRLAGDDLQRLAAAGRRIQEAGVLKAFSFQFCGTGMIAADTTLAGPSLESGQALIVPQQVFAFNGARDELRVVVHGRSGGQEVEQAGTLAIDSTFAKNTYRFPLVGEWSVVAGPSFHTAHRWALIEEFALDIVKIDGAGASGRNRRDRFEDFFAYGADVVAAAAGTVASIVDSEREDLTALRRPSETDETYLDRVRQSQLVRIAAGSAAVSGNLVTIAHPNGEYSHYMHLKPGTIRVRVGDAVAAGQVIASLGSSGNSTEPHLHFQVCDGPQPLTCASLPVNYERITLPLADFPRPLQSGDLVRAR